MAKKLEINHPPFVEVFKHTEQYGPITSRDLQMILNFIQFRILKNNKQLVADLEILKRSGNYTEKEIDALSPNNDKDKQVIIDNFTDWIEEQEEA
jgi:hypothetical protein